MLWQLTPQILQDLPLKERAKDLHGGKREVRYTSHGIKTHVIF